MNLNQANREQFQQWSITKTKKKTKVSEYSVWILKPFFVTRGTPVPKNIASFPAEVGIRAIREHSRDVSAEDAIVWKEQNRRRTCLSRRRSNYVRTSVLNETRGISETGNNDAKRLEKICSERRFPVLALHPGEDFPFVSLTRVFISTLWWHSAILDLCTWTSGLVQFLFRDCWDLEWNWACERTLLDFRSFCFVMKLTNLLSHLKISDLCFCELFFKFIQVTLVKIFSVLRVIRYYFLWLINRHFLCR